jgi:hypothetical protein
MYMQLLIVLFLVTLNRYHCYCCFGLKSYTLYVICVCLVKKTAWTWPCQRRTLWRIRKCALKWTAVWATPITRTADCVDLTWTVKQEFIWPTRTGSILIDTTVNEFSHRNLWALFSWLTSFDLFLKIRILKGITNVNYFNIGIN